MNKVSYGDFMAFIIKNKCHGPDIDFSMEEKVVEDYWNFLHTEVLAFIEFYNDGTINCLVKESI